MSTPPTPAQQINSSSTPYNFMGLPPDARHGMVPQQQAEIQLGSSASAHLGIPYGAYAAPIPMERPQYLATPQPQQSSSQQQQQQTQLPPQLQPQVQQQPQPQLPQLHSQPQFQPQLRNPLQYKSPQTQLMYQYLNQHYFPQIPPHIFAQLPEQTLRSYLAGIANNPLLQRHVPNFTAPLQQPSVSPLAPQAIPSPHVTQHHAIHGPSPTPAQPVLAAQPAPNPAPAPAPMTSNRSPALDFSDFMTTSDDESHRPEPEPRLQSAAGPTQGLTVNGAPYPSPTPGHTKPATAPVANSGLAGDQAAAAADDSSSSLTPPPSNSSAPSQSEAAAQPLSEQPRMASLFTVSSATPQAAPVSTQARPTGLVSPNPGTSQAQPEQRLQQPSQPQPQTQQAPQQVRPTVQQQPVPLQQPQQQQQHPQQSQAQGQVQLHPSFQFPPHPAFQSLTEAQRMWLVQQFRHQQYMRQYQNQPQERGSSEAPEAQAVPGVAGAGVLPHGLHPPVVPGVTSAQAHQQLCGALDHLIARGLKDDKTRSNVLQHVMTSTDTSLTSLSQYKGLLRHLISWLQDLKPAGNQSVTDVYPTVSKQLTQLLARIVRLLIPIANKPDWLNKDLNDIKLLAKRMRRTLDKDFAAMLSQLLDAWNLSTTTTSSTTSSADNSGSSTPQPAPVVPQSNASANGKRRLNSDLGPAAPSERSGTKKTRKSNEPEPDIAAPTSSAAGANRSSSATSSRTTPSSNPPIAPTSVTAAAKGPVIGQLSSVPKNSPANGKPTSTTIKSAPATSSGTVSGTSTSRKRSASPIDADPKKRGRPPKPVDKRTMLMAEEEKRQRIEATKTLQSKQQREARAALGDKSGASSAAAKKVAPGTQVSKLANGKPKPVNPVSALLAGTSKPKEASKPTVPAASTAKSTLPSFRKVPPGTALAQGKKPPAKKGVGLLDTLLQHAKEPSSTSAGVGTASSTSATVSKSESSLPSATDNNKSKPLGRKGGLKLAQSTHTQPKFSGRVSFAAPEQMVTYHDLPKRGSENWHPWWLAADWGAGYEERARTELAHEPFASSLGPELSAAGSGKDQFISSFLSGKDADGSHHMLPRDAQAAQDAQAQQADSTTGTEQADPTASDEDEPEYDPLAPENNIPVVSTAPAAPIAAAEPNPATEASASKEMELSTEPEQRLGMRPWYTPVLVDAQIQARGEKSELARLDEDIPWSHGASEEIY